MIFSLAGSLILKPQADVRILKRKRAVDSSELDYSVLLRAFIDGIDDAVCIRDRERRLVLWNAAFAYGIKANCGVDVRVRAFL